MLFVIMGASGGGKSTALNGLVLKHPQVTWYDFDAVGVPLDADKKWRHRTTERWLKMALEHQSHGQDMGLCGGAVFGELLACPSAHQIAGIAGCLLDCGDVVRMDRLRGRNARDHGISQDMLNWAAWYRMLLTLNGGKMSFEKMLNRACSGIAGGNGNGEMPAGRSGPLIRLTSYLMR